MLENNCNL